MVAASYISCQQGNLTKEQLSFIEETLKHFGLLVRVSGQNPDDVLRTTKLDKKMVGNQIKFILLKTPGDAYIEKNAQKAVKVIHQDDVVDDYFSRIKKEIIRQINDSSEGGEQEADLLMIIKYLERIGDHATNIAEWVLFYITGEHPDVSQL